ncbi:TIGR02680 family protein [Streptomyces hebeiensis]
MTALPSPTPGRWRPLRIGLVDLFHYDVEEFWFRDGRLLLRGNNGTGKSKVLALTLPFLLDGDLSARRVEPDGDPGKRMEWNLLLGGEHPHPERLGYTWIEFGRLDEATGQAHFRTLVCGLKAVGGRGIARHWFAVTEQRIGAGLSLLDATGTPLSRDRFAEAVGGRGMVYDTAKAYRRAVDEALFGLGERRYAALVDLLIQLRQPQLSKRPNEAALSRALTEALPPLDQAVIADVAEAFRSLDEEKEELRAATEAERASSAFLDHYRRYARMAARRRARLPRSEHARYEHLQRELGDAQAQRLHAIEDREAAERRITELDERATRLAAQEAALRAGPEMRDARELDRAATDAGRTARELSRVEDDRRRAVEDHTRATGRLGTAENRLAAAERALAELRDALREAAAAARLPEEPRTPDGTTTRAPHRTPDQETGRTPDQETDRTPGDQASHQETGQASGQAPHQVPDGASETELRRRAREATDRRLRTIEHVETLATRAEQTEAERRAALRRADEAEEDVAHTARRRAEAAERVRGEASAFLAAVRTHLTGCAELALPDLPGLLDVTQDWVHRLDGPNPARTAADAAHRALTARLADEAAVLMQRASVTRERRAGTLRELTALEEGGQRGPEAPRTRTPGAREDAVGAPLWRLVDFRTQVTAAERAGLEAALEASGLLDAWVRPDGAAISADTHDVLLAPSAAVGGPSLADALRPAVDHGDPRAVAVGESTVARVLEAIGLFSDGGWQSGTWVAADGRFRVGELTGSWAKESAEYVGEGAREEARRARIGAARAELAGLEGELEHLTAAHHTVAGRRRALDGELAALPDDDALRHAHALASAAADAAHRAGTRRGERATELAEAAGRAEKAAVELTTAAADMDLPADRAGLAAVRQALADHTALLAALWPALRERGDALRAVAAERTEAGRTDARLAELTARAEEAARDAAAADARHATLRSTVGTAVAELQRRLADTAREARECVEEQKRARDAYGEADRRASHAEGRIDRLGEDVTDATAARERAVAALQRFEATGLLAVALPELPVPRTDGTPWAARPAITLARAIEAELASVDDSDGAWERVQKRLSEEFGKLQDALSRHGHTASAHPGEDGMRVTIVYQGRERAVPELAGALAAEVGELTRVLSAHEREVLETHLITEVAGTLQELIGTAERQVRLMNDELAERPTSTGMRLRLVWRASRQAPQGLAQARERLRQSADAWSPDDRAAVGEFLQAQIARRQAADSGGSWLEDLTAALDYRTWHEFGVERHQHGKWVPATGPASGGERVLAVSVPLFAAASSHYASAAGEHAPRLVTLDEAFAGVDDDSRAKCLGLLHAFDLDVVMTSEREWACYPQVPGIAIAQLSRVDDIPAVLVTRWEWDGTRRLRGTDPTPVPDQGQEREQVHVRARAPGHEPERGPGGTGTGTGAGGQESLWR